MKTTIVDTKVDGDSKIFFVTVEVDQYFSRLADVQMAIEVKDALVRAVSEEMKAEVTAKLKENIAQLVKDVGSDITIAGLKNLLKDHE